MIELPKTHDDLKDWEIVETRGGNRYLGKRVSEDDPSVRIVLKPALELIGNTRIPIISGNRAGGAGIGLPFFPFDECEEEATVEIFEPSSRIECILLKASMRKKVLDSFREGEGNMRAQRANLVMGGAGR